LVDCFKTKGKPNCKQSESANAARDEEEVAFMCMPCDEDDITHKSHSFEPVDNTIDDEGCPDPDSFLDSFGGSDEEDDETVCCSVPDWCPSDEENLAEEWCGIQQDPKSEQEWIEAKHRKVDWRKTKKPLSGSTNDPKGMKMPGATVGNARDKKLTRVHDCKRGKDTTIKVKGRLEWSVAKPHSVAENINFNSNQAVFDNVDRNVKQLCGCGVLQTNSSAHGNNDPPQREFPNDLGPKQAAARAKVGRNSTQCVRSHTRCCEPRQNGEKDGRARWNDFMALAKGIGKDWKGNHVMEPKLEHQHSDSSERVPFKTFLAQHLKVHRLCKSMHMQKETLPTEVNPSLK